jgi:hypothetical protein
MRPATSIAEVSGARPPAGSNRRQIARSTSRSASLNGPGSPVSSRRLEHPGSAPPRARSMTPDPRRRNSRRPKLSRTRESGDIATERMRRPGHPIESRGEGSSSLEGPRRQPASGQPELGNPPIDALKSVRDASGQPELGNPPIDAFMRMRHWLERTTNLDRELPWKL